MARQRLPNAGEMTRPAKCRASTRPWAPPINPKGAHSSCLKANRRPLMEIRTRGGQGRVEQDVEPSEPVDRVLHRGDQRYGGSKEVRHAVREQELSLSVTCGDI